MAEDKVLSNIERFRKICADLSITEHQRYNIGTYMEGPMHLAVKRFITPDKSCYEIEVGRFIADIKIGDKVYEIQTAQFSRLKDKLHSFLSEYDLTVELVYPMPVKRWVTWVDPDNGECSKMNPARKLPSPINLLSEIAPIAEFISSAGFSLTLLELECVDYRMLDGWSHDRKRGSKRFARVPVDMLSLKRFTSRDDYISLLPPLPDFPFTAAVFSSITNLKGRDTYSAIKTLLTLGFLKEDKPCGRAKTYVLSGK